MRVCVIVSRPCMTAIVVGCVSQMTSTQYVQRSYKNHKKSPLWGWQVGRYINMVLRMYSGCGPPYVGCRQRCVSVIPPSPIVGYCHRQGQPTPAKGPKTQGPRPKGQAARKAQTAEVRAPRAVLQHEEHGDQHSSAKVSGLATERLPRSCTHEFPFAYTFSGPKHKTFYSG